MVFDFEGFEPVVFCPGVGCFFVGGAVGGVVLDFGGEEVFVVVVCGFGFVLVGYGGGSFFFVGDGGVIGDGVGGGGGVVGVLGLGECGDFIVLVVVAG